MDPFPGMKDHPETCEFEAVHRVRGDRFFLFFSGESI